MPDAAELAYRVTNLTKIYPRTTVPINDNISFEVKRGEIFGVLGDNGAGKSTLVRQMVGLLRCTSGMIEVFGQPIHQNSEHTSLCVGYMPQQSDALNRLTVGEALFSTAYLRGMNWEESARERNRLLELWDLQALRDTDNAVLSGGQRRLLRLAVAMAGSPPVLVLDEPTNDLDPIRRRMVWNILQSLNAEQHSTIILITHDPVEAEKVIKRVAIMRSGRFVALGRPADLKKNLSRELRVELCFPPKCIPAPGANFFFELQEVNRWIIRGPWEEVIRWLGDLNPDEVESVRIHSPTLEDLYVHYVTTT